MLVILHWLYFYDILLHESTLVILHMKYTIQRIILLIVSLLLLFSPLGVSHAATTNEDGQSYTTLRSIDLGTFNEYRYRLTEQFFNLREFFEVNRKLDVAVLQEMALLANTGYKYLPDNLKNQNYLREFLVDVQRWVKAPSNEIIYTEIITSLGNYMEKVEINSISGSVEATPGSGNAPLTVTFRGWVQDPTGTQILTWNYTWWVDSGWRKVIIGRGASVNYTFREEGTYSVFLDVTSSHKNAEGYTDVLPFRSRADVVIKEKVASVIIKVAGDRVDDNSVLKFTPDDAGYGLLFDGTSSTPTGGAKFIETEWDFGNGATRKYAGPPKVERVRYGREGDYTITLTLTTNEGKQVVRTFSIIVRDPIAKIQANREDGFIGDSFTFSAKSSGLERDLSYSWEIIDIENDTVLVQKADKILTHVFTRKWKYNVRLKVRQSSGEVDQDSYIIYVTSQAPIAEFVSKRPFPHLPNKILLDASRSSDPDFTDDGNLKYEWFIDGKRVKLSESYANDSIGYYEFDSIGSHSITLEVTDPDGITAIRKSEITIDSLLSVEVTASPRVIQRGGFIKFTSNAPAAEVYEWDFGDGKTTWGKLDKVTHTYEKSGTFNVTLKVTDKDNNTNTYTQTVYVSESDQPLAYIDPSFGSLEAPIFDSSACNGEGGYIVDRVSTIKLNGNGSTNIDGTTQGLEYSWKIGQWKFSSASSLSHRFDELWCFPIKLSVKSPDNGATDSTELMMDVRNVKPTLSSLSVNVENEQADPLIINVSAQWATDPDGVILSYLWYYYTDIDPEPQDFRSTLSSSTSFVIPKITGNYYFVAILKDNNEARVTSEEVTGSRYFTTITGDNINTPIVELNVNDNSTVIGEEIVFSAKAQNILGQSIDKDASFSWDFDGDGFYDTQTKEPTTTYTYRKSGEFYAKVKVKYRGISSTKNVTMNVGNKLVPDFGYISIGNKYIFFDNSTGQVDDRQWDLWDGTKRGGTNFTHTYEDKVTSHTVTLKISEGSKVKEVQKVVTKNIKNILKTRGKDFIGFTFPTASEDGRIVLESPSQKVFLYMWETPGEGLSYIIDYDLDHDSDLNGGMDDDEDNAGTASYTSWDVAEIPLSPFKIQKVRMFVKNADGNILGSQDVLIEKTYIEEKEIDPSTIVFDDITESEREKIEELKAILANLPQQQKLQSLSYIQKLQENWNDNTEKTRTILDFENYIFELGLTNETEIINLLESLLVEGQEDQSAKQITYTALVNLIPENIECEVSGGASCYENLLSKLDDIQESDDVEANKVIWKEILEAIGGTDLMTNSQKLDFKAILTSLVYGWDVQSIPDAEKQEVINETPTNESDESSSGILGFIFTILKWIGYFIGVFLLIVAVLYAVYFILGKSKEMGFSEFISNITSFWKDKDGDTTVQLDTAEDILWELSEDNSEESSDILSDIGKKEENIKVAAQGEKVDTMETPKVASDSGEEVPDWLKGNFETNLEKTDSIFPVETSVEKTKLRSDPQGEEVQKSPTVQQESPKNPQEPAKQEEAIKDATQKTEELPSATKAASDNVPDWLKWAADIPTEESTVASETHTPVTDVPQTSVSQEKQETSSQAKDIKADEVDEVTKLPEADANVPDWLKWSFDTETKETKSEEKENKTLGEDITSKKELPKTQDTKKTQTKKSVQKDTWAIAKKRDSEPVKKPSPKKDQKKINPETLSETKVKKETKTDDVSWDTSSWDELWDDGMKIPDWLKTDDK